MKTPSSKAYSSAVRALRSKVTHPAAESLPDPIIHVASDFVDADARRVTCIQAIRRNDAGAVQAIATAVFHDGAITQCIVTGMSDSRFRCAAFDLLSRSTPVTFRSL